MKRIGLIGLCAVLLLTGCTSNPAPQPTPPAPSASAVPSSEAAAPTCDTIASTDSITTALSVGSAAFGALTVAIQPTEARDTAIVRSQGGLACSWRLGEPAQSYASGDGDWAYLRVDVLPLAASTWTTPYAGDAPSTQTASIDGIDAATAQTESGWLVSAPVGEDWVEIALSAGGLVAGEGRFTGAEYDATAGRVADVAEEVFAALKSAAPLTAASSLAAPNGPGACDGGLSPAPIAASVGGDIQTASVERVDTVVYTLAQEAAVRAGEFTCRYTIDGIARNQVSIIPTGGPLLTQMAADADFATGFETIALDGSVDGEEAYGSRSDYAPASTLLFSLGQRLLQVDSFDKSRAIAEAIIAETR